MKTAEEILSPYLSLNFSGPAGDEWEMASKDDILVAMEEYASQYKKSVDWEKLENEFYTEDENKFLGSYGLRWEGIFNWFKSRLNRQTLKLNEMILEPKVCFKCKEVVTFCLCDEPITDKGDYIAYLENKTITHQQIEDKIRGMIEEIDENFEANENRLIKNDGAMRDYEVDDLIDLQHETIAQQQILQKLLDEIKEL